MKTLCTMLLLLPVLAGTKATAQITITADDIERVYTTRTSITTYDATDLTGLQEIAEQTGSALTFDFTSATYSEGETASWETATCAEALPGCDDSELGAANLIIREVHEAGGGDSTAVAFLQLEDDGLSMLGIGAQGEFDDENPGPEVFIGKYQPAWLLQALPFTMGTTWSAETALLVPDFGEEPIFQLEERYEVDGWGTLITPAGSSEALRVWNESISTFSFGGFEFSDTSYTIEFITNGTLGASLYLGEDGTVEDASYTVSAGLGTPAEEPASLPQRVTLAQNFPNPFNPATTIAFTLQDAQQVRLAVFDVLGREVAVLVDGFRPAGTHEVVWRAGGLPSGLYLYQLEAGAVTLTRQLSLIK